MKILQKHWTPSNGWQSQPSNGTANETADRAQLALVFGDISLLRRRAHIEEIRRFFPAAHILGCSSAGEIMGPRVFDNSLAATAVFFENSTVRFAETSLGNGDSYNAGRTLARELPPEGLVHVLVLSDGLDVNGSVLVHGLRAELPTEVAVTGGLAADQDRFTETLVFLDRISESQTVVAVGFYGESLRIGYGSKGGWDPFGPDRLVTRSDKNVLYELDGQLTLELYKKYLGEQAAGLPATGLLFPLSIALDGGEKRLVRTMQSINEQDGSITFTADIPEGHYGRLMRGNIERLLDGAADSARQSQENGPSTPELALLISCVGRKLVLKQRTEEEVESVQDALGESSALTGFYSYGEICPVAPTETQAELHNQTMTITTFSEQ